MQKRATLGVSFSSNLKDFFF
uniref:Uncharacterized protein n=1 Tax=Rhizophora mucronata TaxID=61149 RepID=A0A2P2PJH4_RHIMU